MFNDKLTLAEFSTYFTKYKGYLDSYEEEKEEEDFNLYNKDIA